MPTTITKINPEIYDVNFKCSCNPDLNDIVYIIRTVNKKRGTSDTPGYNAVINNLKTKKQKSKYTNVVIGPCIEFLVSMLMLDLILVFMTMKTNYS